MFIPSLMTWGNYGELQRGQSPLILVTSGNVPKTGLVSGFGIVAKLLCYDAKVGRPSSSSCRINCRSAGGGSLRTQKRSSSTTRMLYARV